jgi:hypothetical protein
LSFLEIIEGVKRRIYGQLYAGPPGFVPDWAELPALLDALIRECRRLDEDRVALRGFREKLLALFRGSGGRLAWTPELKAAWAPADAELNALRDSVTANQREEAARNAKPRKQPKRGTEPGEARAKLIAALTKHHQYADGGCLNLAPIGNNELARLATVAESTASVFFKEKFRGWAKYRLVCRDAGRLADSLKALNGEFAPHELYGRRPPDEENEVDCVDD